MTTKSEAFNLVDSFMRAVIQCERDENRLENQTLHELAINTTGGALYNALIGVEQHEDDD